MWKSICLADDCDSRAQVREFCRHHYEIYRRTVGFPEQTPCGVVECARKAITKGYCHKHYQRWMAHGDPRVTKSSERGTGCVNANGYRVFTVSGRHVAEHRRVMEAAIGRNLRKGETVHHKNGVRLDNHIENLELWTTAHPAGQRASDLLSFARDIIVLYGDLPEGL